MTGVRWAETNYLYVAGAILVILVIALALDFTWRKRVLERIGHAPQLLRMAQSVSPGRRGMKVFLTVLGISLVTLVLARPQVEGASKWRQRGIDVAVVIDFSKSMLAKDVYPSRIEHAKLEAEAIIDALGGDRVSVVAFAGGSAHYPLTTDYEAAKLLFRGLSPLDMAPGSDLGDAVLTARCMLQLRGQDGACARRGGRGRGGDPLDEREARRFRGRRQESVEVNERARAIVILTDGEDTEGGARTEVERAVSLGIQVYVVGIGTKTGDRIPQFDERGNEVGWTLTPDGRSYYTTRLDEGALKGLAQAGGGEDRYFRDDPKRIGLQGLVKALSMLKEGDLEQRIIKQFGEAYQWLLFPAFLVLVIEACLADRKPERGQKARA
ncbi:MAG: VWA domain-containing protein [Deltaproteobacteria bacterium]|nr:VWA domain-containing protein [Deltaproteobacteria bacterium]